MSEEKDTNNKPKITDKIEEDDVYIRKLLESIEDGVLEDRVAHELYTYARRAKIYKRFYIVCFVISISMPTVAAALQFMDGTVWKVIVVMLMGSVTISTGFISGLKIREKWEHYRCYCETMKQEIFCCLMGIGEAYKDRGDEEREKLLAERLEEMIDKEAEAWRKIRPQFPVGNAQINNGQVQLNTSDKTGR